jgi:hypothetical protein
VDTSGVRPDYEELGGTDGANTDHGVARNVGLIACVASSVFPQLGVGIFSGCGGGIMR